MLNPSAKSREILCRYVLKIRKPNFEEIQRWHRQNEYKLETYWIKFKADTKQAANKENVEDNESEIDKTAIIIDIAPTANKKIEKDNTNNIDEEGPNAMDIKQKILQLLNADQIDKACNLLLQFNKTASFQHKILGQKKESEELETSSRSLSASQYRNYKDQIIDSLTEILYKSVPKI